MRNLANTSHARTSHALPALTALVLTALTAMSSLAGPFRDFEKELSEAYAPYRAALMQTNQKNMVETQKALAAFETRWSALSGKYRSAPPPQYAEDADFQKTMAEIDAVLVASRTAVAKGDLAGAHEILEVIRDKLGEMRSRNGLISFSDRMDAYHTQMEHVLKAPRKDTAEGLAFLREEAAVLVHILAAAEKHVPIALKNDPAYAEAMGSLRASATDLLEAVRSNKPQAIEAAMKALKPAYARFFVKFG